MKRIACALALAVTLTGCGLAPAKYDQTEQQGWAGLYVNAKHLMDACGEGSDKTRAIAREMRDEAELLGAYLEYQLPSGSVEIMRHYQALLFKFDPRGGTAYCKDSAANLRDAAVRAMKTNGGRER